MKTKLFTLLLALVTSVGTIFAQVQIGDLYYYLNADNKTAEVTYQKDWSPTNYSYLTAIIIPASVDYNSVTYSVTSIGIRAFNECSGLTSITIPNSVKSIGWNAFVACSGLTSVTIPNSVTSIGNNAFSWCTGLTSIEIPNSVTSIGERAFEYCRALTSVTIPNSVKSIKRDTFQDCTRLTSVTIGNSVTSIGEGAFYECTALTSVTIPNSVTSIGSSAFSYCSGLTSITIPNSVTSIGNRAFWGCLSLTSIDIPNSVTSIGQEAFEICRALTSVTIGNSVTSIGGSAFSGCSGLTSVTIGNSVTSIGDEAFRGCIGLRSVTNYATTPQTINSNVFKNVNLSSCTLYVPKGSVDRYKAAEVWKGFESILPISAEKTEVTTPTIEPDATSAEIAWPQVSSAYSYELVIKDASGNTICTLVFNAQGQLTSIAFNAPARENAGQQTQSAGFAFTVNGLEPGTQYNYSIIAKNESGTVLNVEEGTFRTLSPEAVDEVSDGQSRGAKFLRSGQIFILRGDKTYTITGQKVK